MSLLLFILAAIGGFIFLVAYLIIVIASFKHHTVTGLISLIPGINLVVLPTILGKTGKAFPTSVFALGLALVTWYAGGHRYLQNYLYSNPAASIQTDITETSVNPINNNLNLAAAHKTKELPLPSKPLYYIVYTKVDSDQLGDLINKHIRITLVDDREFEGKNIEITTTSLLLETHDNNENHMVKIPLKHIVSVEKLETKS
ncbi:MAG: hypothetical protein V3U84_09685 [Thiotrichaceae bacterium]